MDRTPGPQDERFSAGSPSTWHVTSNGKQGYVADRLEWARLTGMFEARVTLSSDGPANVEVWDNTGNVLLARDSLPSTDGKQTVTLPVNATRDYRKPLYSGWGPFRAKFGGGPKGERLEVRVWTPGGDTVSVYSAQLRTLSHCSLAARICRPMAKPPHPRPLLR